jgi:hypothetical protein
VRIWQTPLTIDQLSEGDRVLLNCPKSPVGKREALFLRITTWGEERPRHQIDVSPVPGNYAPSQKLAVFQLQVGHGRVVTARAGVQVDGDSLKILTGGFAIQQDGTLKDDEGRAVFIERRVFAGQG